MQFFMGLNSVRCPRQAMDRHGRFFQAKYARSRAQGNLCDNWSAKCPEKTLVYVRTGKTLLLMKDCNVWTCTCERRPDYRTGLCEKRVVFRLSERLDKIPHPQYSGQRGGCWLSQCSPRSAVPGKGVKQVLHPSPTLAPSSFRWSGVKPCP